jgi:hypothetical protein
MSDPTETQPSPQLTAEAAASPDPHGSPAAQPAKEPDLASLLSEFEASTATPKPEPQPPQADPVPATPTPAVDPIAAGMAGFDDLARAHRLETENKALAAEVAAARAYIDRQHFSEATAAIEKRLADYELPVPEGFVKTALMAAAHDPAIARAWDARGENPAAFAKVMRKLQDGIVAQARSFPDPEATANRAAVAAAVRGTSTKNYKEPTPKYSEMDDATFAKEKAKFGL